VDECKPLPQLAAAPPPAAAAAKYGATSNTWVQSNVQGRKLKGFRV